VELADLKQEEENEQFLEQYISNKLDYFEWTEEDEILVSPVLLEIAREFIKQPFTDYSNTKGSEQ
jgi:hypothetical protein